MANKTIILLSDDLRSQTPLTIEIVNRTTGATVNGSGDTLTEDGSAPGRFTATVTEAITGWFMVRVLKSSSPIAFGGDLFIEADEAGNYLVDDPQLKVPQEPDNELIATSVFQLLVGSGVARYALPVASSEMEALRYVDFDLDITTAATAAESKFVVTINCEAHDEPYLEADSVTGLLSLPEYDGTLEATWASVVRVSSTLVRVYVSVHAMKNIPAGEHLFELREITDDRVKLRYEKALHIRSGAGRVIV